MCVFYPCDFHPLFDGGSCKFFAVEVSQFDHAVRSGLGHSLADVVLLGLGERRALHSKRLEGGLSGEEGEQRCRAYISAHDHIELALDGDSFERVGRAVSEHLEELVPIPCTAARVFEV